jgi:uncharacterized protein
MVRFSFCGHELTALPQGALFWPARRALLVADLHLEKASWFAKGGQMLPPYDSIATLADLTAIAAATDAAEIWCLGDSFHDSAGCDRLPAEARALLTALTQKTRWTWITGNHDPGIADHEPAAMRPAHGCEPRGGSHRFIGGEIVEEAEVDGLLLRHEADPVEGRPELSGHFHPKLRIHLRGRLVSRRCFVATERKLILPAFGALTGGLDAHHPEIVRAVGAGAEALVPVRDRLLRFPIAA